MPEAKGSWREGRAICGAATTLEPACYNVPCIMREIYFKQMRASTRIVRSHISQISHIHKFAFH